MSDFVKYELKKIKADILKKRGKETQGLRTDLLSNIDKKLPEHNTQKTIADDLQWSTGKVAMADIVDKKAPDCQQIDEREKSRSDEIIADMFNTNKQYIREAEKPF